MMMMVRRCFSVPWQCVFKVLMTSLAAYLRTEDEALDEDDLELLQENLGIRTDKPKVRLSLVYLNAVIPYSCVFAALTGQAPPPPPRPLRLSRRHLRRSSRPARHLRRRRRRPGSRSREPLRCRRDGRFHRRRYGRVAF